MLNANLDKRGISGEALTNILIWIAFLLIAMSVVWFIVQKLGA
mgnify:CR=1 FL=1